MLGGSQSEGVQSPGSFRDDSPKGTMMGQVMLYAITTLKTFNVHAYSRPYWKSMAWFWGRRQGSSSGGLVHLAWLLLCSLSGMATSLPTLVAEKHLAPPHHASHLRSLRASNRPPS